MVVSKPEGSIRTRGNYAVTLNPNIIFQSVSLTSSELITNIVCSLKSSVKVVLMTLKVFHYCT